MRSLFPKDHRSSLIFVKPVELKHIRRCFFNLNSAHTPHYTRTCFNRILFVCQNAGLTRSDISQDVSNPLVLSSHSLVYISCKTVSYKIGSRKLLFFWLWSDQIWPEEAPPSIICFVVFYAELTSRVDKEDLHMWRLWWSGTKRPRTSK